MSKKLLIKSLVCAAALMSGSIAFADNIKSIDFVAVANQQDHQCSAAYNSFASLFQNDTQSIIHYAFNKYSWDATNILKLSPTQVTFSCHSSEDSDRNYLTITVTDKTKPVAQPPHVVFSLEKDKHAADKKLLISKAVVKDGKIEHDTRVLHQSA